MKSLINTMSSKYARGKFLRRYSFVMLRYALAIIFFWFGILKPLGLSPAAELIEKTVTWFPPEYFIPILGWWEVAIGIFLCFRKTVSIALVLLFLQIPGTFLPLVLYPEAAFVKAPFVLTLEGQYIIKNFLLIAAAIAVAGAINLPTRHDRVV